MVLPLTTMYYVESSKSVLPRIKVYLQISFPGRITSMRPHAVPVSAECNNRTYVVPKITK